ncbi:MAG: SDR family oxidoreductase [Deltaproteobacteria bacterium]|nr:SDR family oxidoreductase [Deltaproteobacteria bacterium]
MGIISYNLKDKVAVVTGGSRGIGLEIAKRLLEEGAQVAICGRKEEGLSKASEKLEGGDNLIAIQTHVAKEADVDKLFKGVVEKFGSIDILINNVGMNIMVPSVADAALGLWQKIIDTNLNGTFLCSRSAAEIMKTSGGGSIVNISSISGRRASPTMGIYGIAKAGVEMFTKVLAAELSTFKIRVNAVAPGMVRTDFSKPLWSNPTIHEEIVKGIPMGRIAECIEVVHPTLFLASDAASYITGQTIVVDGGSTTSR